jgi:WD40 repeat protein
MHRLWDAETGAQVGEPMRGHTDIVCSVKFSPDDKYIISGADNQTIRIWDAETRAQVGEPLRGHTDEVWFVAILPNSKHIVSGSQDKTIQIWDAEKRVQVGEPLRGNSLNLTQGLGLGSAKKCPNPNRTGPWPL